MTFKKTLIALSLTATLALTGCGGSKSSGGSGGGSKSVSTAISSLQTLQTSLESLQGSISKLENNAANKATIANITDNVIVSGYANLANQANALTGALANLKDNPSNDTLAAAQNAWRATRVFWESGEGHIFGPVDTLSVDPKVDSWPVSKAELDGSLNGWTGGSVEGFPDEIRGFHAIEYILFGDGVKTNTRDISTLNQTQLNFVHALGASMAGQMKRLVDAWTGDYTATFKSFTVASAAEELLGGLVGIADEVGHGKMGDPFNAKDTTLVESQFSWNSTTDFSNNIISIRNVWNGGFGKLMAQVDAAGAAKVEAQINDAISKIIAISDVNGDGVIDVNNKDAAFRNQILK